MDWVLGDSTKQVSADNFVYSLILCSVTMLCGINQLLLSSLPVRDCPFRLRHLTR